MTTPLEVMRTLAGTEWSSGPATGAVREWVEFLATIYPERASYVRQAEHDYLAWCGLTVAYTTARCGIRPPDEFLLAMSWASWGTDARSNPQRGDIAVFAWSSGGHHVTEIDEVMSASQFRCFGGNQSHQVNDEPMPRASCIAVRRQPAATVPATPLPAPVPTPPTASNFNACVALVLVSEGGNDDDKRDPGGRTSRGITQAEWDKWRASGLNLPDDVWQAPQSQILIIYKQDYWDVLCCDQLPAGVDYAVFDFGVNSGNARAAKFLQAIVGADQDGEIGPDTIAATAKADPKTVINTLCANRMDFLRGLSTWSTFGRGWTARVSRVNVDAANMAARGKAPPDVPAPPKPPGNPPPPATAKTHPFDKLFGGDWQAGLNQMFGGKK